MNSPFLDAKETAGSGQPPDALRESNAITQEEKIVEIKGLKVVYNPGKSNEARALNGITIDIFTEEYVIFFGPSGCGKSTLLNVIAGLETPTEGEVDVAGQLLASFDANQLSKFHCKTTGMIFQSYNLIPTLNVLDNIILPQIFDRVRSTKRKEAGKQLLQKLGLEVFERRLPQELSGGQQQRVGIARALINDPPIILADEAVGNLDSTSAKNVLEILNKLNLEDRKTIISVTHNPEHLFYADRVFYMRDGQVIKVEVNKERRKNQQIIKKDRTPLDLLLQAFPDLSAMQLHIMLAPFKAKILANYLISRLDAQEIEKLEKIITERLLDRINREALMSILDAPSEQGGLGLNKTTATDFADIIEEVVSKGDYIKETYKVMEKEVNPIKETVIKVRQSLMDEFKGTLTLGQIEALDKGIEYRILNKISKSELQEYLDRAYVQGGVGLGRATAKNFAKKLEIIMLMEYGKV